MSDYYIFNVDVKGGGTFVSLLDRFDEDFSVELYFDSLMDEKMIREYVDYMNYPFRDGFYYICSEHFDGGGVYYIHLYCDEFDCFVKSKDLSCLDRFVYNINNPSVISVDVFKGEYNRLSVEINDLYDKVKSLEKVRDELVFKY